MACIGGLSPTLWQKMLSHLQAWICTHNFCISLAHISEKAMATHSSTLAWKIPWMEEPGGLQSMGSLGVGHDWATFLSLFTFMHWRRKWQPTPVFLPGESQGRGEPGGLLSLGSHRVGHDWSDLATAAATHILIFLANCLLDSSILMSISTCHNGMFLFPLQSWSSFLTSIISRTTLLMDQARNLGILSNYNYSISKSCQFHLQYISRTHLIPKISTASPWTMLHLHFSGPLRELPLSIFDTYNPVAEGTFVKHNIWSHHFPA